MLSDEQKEIISIFEKHVAAELAGDLNTTTATMSENSHVLHVPSMMGALAAMGCKNFIKIGWLGNFSRQM